MPIRLTKTALAAFAAVYLIWGSTFLAIRYAIATIPPITLSAVRFALAALVMAALALSKREAPLSGRERRVAAISGALLVLANCIVCVSEQWVPSGIVAVIAGVMPIWVMVGGWFFFGQARPELRRVAGALIGLGGIALIVFGSPGSAPASSAIDGATLGDARLGIGLVLGSSWLWAVGTLVQRRITGIASPVRYSAEQMAFGAVAAAIASFAFEKPWAIEPGQISGASWAALLYLVIFGSVVAFTAYAWLSRNVEPHLVSTYALVNPVVAVALGWLFLKEPVTPSFAAATAIVVVGLLLLMKKKAASADSYVSVGPCARTR